jgi:hypothetical protein
MSAGNQRGVSVEWIEIIAATNSEGNVSTQYRCISGIMTGTDADSPFTLEAGQGFGSGGKFTIPANEMDPFQTLLK